MVIVVCVEGSIIYSLTVNTHMVDFEKTFSGDLFIDDVCLEYSSFVVGEHSTVKEEL